MSKAKKVIDFIQESSAKSMVDTIMKQMAVIEKNQGKMFHEIDSKFEKEIMDAIDSKNVAKLNTVIKKLDGMS